MPKLVTTLCSLSFLCSIGPDTLSSAEFLKAESITYVETGEHQKISTGHIQGLRVESLSSFESEENQDAFYGVWIDPSLNLSDAHSVLTDKLKNHLGSPLSEQILQELRIEIAQFYHEQKKNFASIELDPQNTADGIVHIVVTEKNLDARMTTENRLAQRETIASPPLQYTLTAGGCQRVECEDEACEEDSIYNQIRAPHLNSRDKFALLAEKTDQLAKTVDEICCKDIHINPCVHEHIQNALVGLSVSADFLYWQADEDDLGYAIYSKGLSLNPNFNLSYVKEAVRGLSFEWNPGFRVGIGATARHWDHCGFLFSYTHMRSKADGSTDIGTLTTNVDSFLASTWDQVLLGIYASAAKANWSVNYNTEILDAYRDCFLGKNLIVRPRIGLLNANINQEYEASYTLDPNRPILSKVPEAKMRAKCSYWGLGVRGGADLLWHFTEHFGFYGELSAGLVYGRFHVTRDGNSSYPINASAAFVSIPYTFEFKKEIWRARATIQTALGLEWETTFNGDRNRIAISVGYEFNEWFRQNQFVQSTHQPAQNNFPTGNVSVVHYNFSNADLAFKGGTLRAVFDF